MHPLTGKHPGHAWRKAIVPQEDAAQEDCAIEPKALPCLLLQQQRALNWVL